MSNTADERQVSDLKRQIETLQQSERLYRQLIEESADGILVADAQANCLEVNRATCEMLGYTRDELLGLNMGHLVVAEDRAARPPCFDELRTGNIVQSQRQMRHKDGSVVWAEVSARTLPDGRMLATLRDITERRRIEAVQQASLSLTASLELPQVLDAILGAVLRLVPAQDTHIFLYREDRLTFGAAMAREGRLDRPATEIRSNGLTYTVARTGKMISIEHPSQNPFPGGAPPHRPGAIVGLPLMIGPTVVGVMNVYYPAARRIPEAELHVLSLLSAQAAIAIENAQLHDTIRRHSRELEQRVAERTAELERERSHLQAILDSAGEGVEIQDRDGTIRYINPAAELITGYSAAELIGKSPARLLRSEHTPPAVVEDLERALARGQAWRGEVVNRRKDGTVFDAALTLTPIQDESGQVTGYVGVQRDITHLKELDRLKNQFVSRIGHELRTPLANIKLHIDLLERGKPDKREQYMHVLRRETARLRKLIEGFLEMSQLDAGVSPIDLAETDVNQLAAEVITRQSTPAAERSLVFDFQPRSNLPLALVDPNLLTSVMSHLVENAVNYTPHGGSVTVTTNLQRQDERNWITFTVQDTGAGLSADDEAHLFERFYRGAAAHNFTVPGAGLGLPICKAIVDKLGGRITVDSRPGEGTTFTVWLESAR